jgi:acetyltransferase
VESARQAGRTLLTEFESKRLLATYGIQTVETRVASSENEAVASADKLGYPVVLKVLSDTITHKTDVGGVQLRLSGANAVRRAYREIEASVRSSARCCSSGQAASSWRSMATALWHSRRSPLPWRGT